MKIYIEVSHYFRDSAGRGVDRVVSEILRYMPDLAKRQNIDLRYLAEFDDGILREIARPEPLATSISGQSHDRRGRLPVTHLLKRVVKRTARLIVPYGMVLWGKNLSLGYKLQSERRKYSEVKFGPGDIIFCPDAGWIMGESYIGAVTSAAKMGAKIVPLFYDLIPLDHPDFFKESEVKRFSDWFNKLTSITSHALAISDSTRIKLKKEITKGAIKQGVETTLLGADFKYNPAAPISGQVISTFEVQRPYVVVGTMETRKNQELVLKAFQNLWGNGINARVVFIGSVLPSSRRLYEQMLRLPQWGNLLRVIQGTEDHELSFCYANAKALISPSLAEGFDLPVIEALHYGLPVFASNIDVHREIAKSIPTYFDPNSINDLTSKLEYFENTEMTPPNLEGHKWPSWEESVMVMFKKITDLGSEHA